MNFQYQIDINRFLYLKYNVMVHNVFALIPATYTSDLEMFLTEMRPDEFSLGFNETYHELLAGGRFRRFAANLEQSFENALHSVKSGRTFASTRGVEDQINWIHEQTLGRWSMRVESDVAESPEEDDFHLCFLFTEARDAVLFKTFCT